MMAPLYNREHQAVGEITLPEKVFSVAWKPTLVKQAFTAQLANRRRPWAHVKGRAEVRGGGRKPWRQKGTGRARHGSIRSPLWRGGGKAHGSQSTRDYYQKINKKMRRLALLSILSRKLHDHQIKFFDELTIQPVKTKLLKQFLTAPAAAARSPRRKIDVLLVPATPDRALARAAANLTKVKVLPATTLNVYDLLSYNQVWLDRRAVPVITDHYLLH